LFPIIGEVVIRTNSFETTLTINAPLDTVHHHGEAASVVVTAVSSNSLFVNGTVPFINMGGGRVVLKPTSEVQSIYITNKEAIIALAPEVELPSFSVNPGRPNDLLFTVQTLSNQIDSNGNPVVDTIVSVEKTSDGLKTIATKNGTSVSVPQVVNTIITENKEALVNGVEEDLVKVAIKFAGGKGTKNDPYLIANGNQWVSMCTLYHYGGTYYGIEQGDEVYIKLVSDIDLSDVELFDTYFASGLHLDGNDKIVSNANFVCVFGNYADGLNFYGENEIKNITFENCHASKHGLFGNGTNDSTDTVSFLNVKIKNSSALHGMFLYYTGGAKINFENCSTESASVSDRVTMGVGGYVGNGQGITINNCKFGGSVVSTSQMAAGFVGQGKAVITNSEVTAGSVIRNINAGGKVAVYDGQGGGAREGDNNTFNGVLSCDTQTNAVKQGTNATWKQFIGLKATDFVIRENGMIEYLGESREFSKVEISESIFENTIYDPTGTYLGQYLPGGFSCYWEDLITVDNINSNDLYKIDKVTGLVNYVSEFYADKVSCSTTVEPDVEWTRYRSYLDRKTGTLYYNGVYEGDAYCQFLGTAAKLDAENNLVAKLPCTGTINVKISAYDSNNVLVGTVTLSYTVVFASAE